MAQDSPDLERRLTEIQTQINRLSLSLHLWRERQDRLQPAEDRLSRLTDQCSELVERWKVTGERQAQAVGELEQRLKQWDAPSRSLSPVGSGRESPAARASDPEPQSGGVKDPLSDGAADSSQGIHASSPGFRERGMGRLGWLLVLLVGVVVSGVIGTRLQRRFDERVIAEQARAAAAAANQEVVAAREDAARQVAEARENARKAQAISDVLAAPDLARFSLGGRSLDRRPLAAQGLWSRSRGFVFSGSRLPPPPPDSTYQIWLLTSTHAVNAGTFVPDESGRFTFVTAPPPSVRLLTGMSVTIERAGGTDRPTGMTVMTVH